MHSSAPNDSMDQLQSKLENHSRDRSHTLLPSDNLDNDATTSKSHYSQNYSKISVVYEISPPGSLAEIRFHDARLLTYSTVFPFGKRKIRGRVCAAVSIICEEALDTNDEQFVEDVSEDMCKLLLFQIPVDKALSTVSDAYRSHPDYTRKAQDSLIDWFSHHFSLSSESEKDAIISRLQSRLRPNRRDSSQSDIQKTTHSKRQRDITIYDICPRKRAIHVPRIESPPPESDDDERAEASTSISRDIALHQNASTSSNGFLSFTELGILFGRFF